MRTDDLDKRAGKKSQHIIYKTIAKSALSVHFGVFFLYKGGRGRGPGGRGLGAWGPRPAPWTLARARSSRACALLSLA